MGPASMAAERNVIRYMARLIGFSESAMHLNHGRSAGNLTALLAARQAMSEYKIGGGAQQMQPAGIPIVFNESHYSVGVCQGDRSWRRLCYNCSV
ncbi:MAG: hypothetical protein U5L72_02210 [Bacteroidales bacterium]|nr:hypothetical protein [Bacteroidales bacterium]